MEDDDEIQSHRSARSGSQNSQRSDRRISVTVASAARHQNTLTVALPMPQPRTVAGGGGGGRGGGGGGGGGGREDCWSEGATAVLIDAWGERYVELNRGNLKQKHWKEVADIVNSRDDCRSKAPKTDVQCKNRIDTVKKKYKLEKTKITSAGGRSSWIFYDRLDQLIGNTVKNSSSSLATPPLRSVPVGIPVGVRSAPVQSLRLKQQQQQQQQHQHQQLQQQRKRLRSPPASSDSSESEPEPSRDSPESDSGDRKRPRVPFNACSTLRQQKQRSREKNRGDSVGELTKAIMKFAEAYEQMESSKMQKMVELQKQSMKFAKELELQRIQFFMKTQLELSQLKHSRRNGENDNKIHHSNNRNTINNNNRSVDRNN